MANWRDMEEAEPEQASRGPVLKINKPVQAAVDSVYEELQASDEDMEDISEEVRTLSEVERRLKKANYYQAILAQPLFGGDPSEEALDVEYEMREFALKRLRALLGIDIQETPVAPVSVFSPDEELALKTLAAKILAKPAVLEAPVAPVAIKTMEPVEPPKPKPTVRASPAPQVQPKLRTIVDQAPALKRRPGRPTAPPKAEAKPVEPPKPTPKAKKKVMEVEAQLPDGTTKTVQLNLSGQTVDSGRAPMPSPEQMMLMEQMKAQENENRNVVLQNFKAATGDR